MKLSVVICTYNPNIALLNRVLDALKNQTLPMREWELIVVDNKSEKAVAERINLQWHPNARIVFEEAPGLTNARHRGYKEAETDLLVYVDDDNILYEDYLEKCHEISGRYPFLGVWGGSTFPEFEIEPPEWFHTSILGLRTIERDHWSNAIGDLMTTPIGAGMCVRKNVAQTYFHSVQTSPLRQTLERSGTSLMSAGDFDLAYTACDLGMGKGVFTDLKMIHVIPKARLTEAYFLKLKEGISCSLFILSYLRKPVKLTTPKNSLKRRLKHSWRYLRQSPMDRKIEAAKQRGRLNAREIVKNHLQSENLKS